MPKDAIHLCTKKFATRCVLMDTDGGRVHELACNWYGKKCSLNTHPCFITKGAPMYDWAESLLLDKSEDDDEICIPYSVWSNSPGFTSALEATLAAVAGSSNQFANMVTPAGRMWLVMLSAIAHVIGAEMPSGAAPMTAIYKQVRPPPRPATPSVQPNHPCSHTCGHARLLRSWQQ